MNSPSAAFRRILEVLDRLKIPYCIVGSVASSVYGTPRTTMDVDVVADLRASQLDSFAQVLHPGFYVDLEMMKDAWSRGRSFNVIHLAAAVLPRHRAWAASPWSASSPLSRIRF